MTDCVTSDAGSALWQRVELDFIVLDEPAMGGAAQTAGLTTRRSSIIVQVAATDRDVGLISLGTGSGPVNDARRNQFSGHITVIVQMFLAIISPVVIRVSGV